jgi:hypothetical protein
VDTRVGTRVRAAIASRIRFRKRQTSREIGNYE